MIKFSAKFKLNGLLSSNWQMANERISAIKVQNKIIYLFNQIYL